MGLIAFIAVRTDPNRVFLAFAENVTRSFLLLRPQGEIHMRVTIQRGDDIDMDIELPRHPANPQRYLRCGGHVTFVRLYGEPECSIGVTIIRMQLAVTPSRMPNALAESQEQLESLRRAAKA